MGSPSISGPTTGTVQQGVGNILNGTYSETTNTITAHTWSISVQGTYGFATINSSGQLTYDLDDQHPVLKALDPGQTTTDVFQVRVTDMYGTSTMNVTITIQGNFCFAAGTRVKTAEGLRAIETVKVGDLVETLDRGLQPVRWVGRQSHSAQVLQLAPKLRGIVIGKGALGHGLPRADVCVSRHHRIMLQSDLAHRLFGQAQVLVPAHRLIGLPGVASCDYAGGIDYCHLLFDRHELLMVEGIAAETLFLGAQNEIDFADKSLLCEGAMPAEYLARCAKVPVRPIPPPDIQRKVVAEMLRSTSRAAA